MFVYHWLNRTEEDYWERFGTHLGTLWDRVDLERMNSPSNKDKNSVKKDTIFIPLSLVMNPELPAALLGKNSNTKNTEQTSTTEPEGDDLRTGMPLPRDSEIVNMANLEKDEFFGLIANAGLTKIDK